MNSLGDILRCIRGRRFTKARRCSCTSRLGRGTPMNVQESFGMMKSLHVSGNDKITDDWIRFCESLLHESSTRNLNPEQNHLVAQAIEAAIVSIVAANHRPDIAEQIEACPPEDRQILARLINMSAEGLRNYFDSLLLDALYFHSSWNDLLVDRHLSGDSQAALQAAARRCSTVAETVRCPGSMPHPCPNAESREPKVKPTRSQPTGIRVRRDSGPGADRVGLVSIQSSWNTSTPLLRKTPRFGALTRGSRQS